MKTLKRVVWRFLLILYCPLFYAMDMVEGVATPNSRRYADGEDWSFERTRIEFLRLWYKY